MNCRELEELLLDDLQAADRREARQHLENCSACEATRRELQALGDLSSMLQREAETPDEFTAQVVDRIQAGSNQRSTGRLAATAAVMVVMSAVVLWNLISNAPATPEVLVGATRWVARTLQLVETDPLGRATGSPLLVSEADSLERPAELPPLAAATESTAEFDTNEPPIQLILETPSQSEYILEVPSRIKIHRQELHDDFYLTQVSH